MWRKRLVFLVLVAALSQTFCANATADQWWRPWRAKKPPVVDPGPGPGDPGSRPRLQSTDLTYLGQFRVPSSANGVSSYAHGGGLGIGYGGGIAYNAGSGGLFVTCEQQTFNGGLRGAVGEVSIPAAINSATISSLNTATVVQNCTDISEGHVANLNDVIWMASEQYAKLGSILPYNGRLIHTVFHQYDGGNISRMSVGAHSLTLATSGWAGWQSVYIDTMQGFTSWWMTLTGDWSTLLGGPALVGNCCLSVISRTSMGPSAFAFNPDDITGTTLFTLTATALLYYPVGHPTLGLYDQAPPVEYNQTVEIGGMSLIPGTRTLLFFGRQGENLCYGPGTNDKSKVGTPAPPAGEYNWCFDDSSPGDTGQGAHGSPYYYKFWAYDLNDLVKVKNGTTNPATGSPWQPWEVVPYASWPISFPNGIPLATAGGMTVNPVTGRMYLSLGYADTVSGISAPLIQVIQGPTP